MITIRNTQRRIKLNLDRFKQRAQIVLNELGYTDFDLGIWFTTNETIRRFNREYRQKDKPTDILSFPYHQVKAGQRIVAKTPEEENLGDLIISPAYVTEEAKKYNVSLEERLDTILVHGICHLLGYDHYTSEQDILMRKQEERLLKKINQGEK